MPQVGETRANPNDPSETATWTGTEWQIERASGGRNGRAAPAPPPPGSRTGAPDIIGRRQDYQTGVDELARDRRGLNNTAPFFDSLDRFQNLNRGTPTGGFVEQIPGVRVWWNNLTNQPRSEMQGISADLQTHNVPQGQGPVSNFERTLYALPQPDINRHGRVNDNLIASERASRQEETDRVAFYERWLESRGSLNGAQEAWLAYTRQHPYRRTNAAGDVEVLSGNRPSAWDLQRIEDSRNRARTTWRQHWQRRRGSLDGADQAFDQWWATQVPDPTTGRRAAAPQRRPQQQPARRPAQTGGGRVLRWNPSANGGQGALE